MRAFYHSFYCVESCIMHGIVGILYLRPPPPTHLMPYRKHGYDLRYLRDFKRRRPKTWDQLDREQERRDKRNAKRMARAVQAALEQEELDKARAVASAARSARLKACNYKPEPSPEPGWVTVRSLTAAPASPPA